MITALRNLPAPAKLNLFLHVTGRRADGYHLLETVFEMVDLCDSIDLHRRDDSAIIRPGHTPGVAADSDLTLRAARLLAEHTGQPAEKVKQDTERDNFMSAEEAMEYGIIDQVIKHR